MNTKSLKTLEYNKIITQLETYASSPLGRDLCRNLVPSIDVHEIRQMQKETSDCPDQSPPERQYFLYRTEGCRWFFKTLEIGSSLNITELLAISSMLTIAARAKAYGRHEDDDEYEDSLEEMFRLLEPLTPLNNEIKRCILSEDEISDEASPGLHKVRRSMKAINDKVHSQLNAILNSNRTYLQDAVITMRDGRYCLPVKSEYKSQVPGMVHDQSSTGSTLFIEPMAVIQLNNQLRELEIQEKKEIEAVLADLSNQTAPYTESDFIKHAITGQIGLYLCESGAVPPLQMQ